MVYVSLFVGCFCQIHAELLPEASSCHFDKLISKQGGNIPCDPCDNPCDPALTCEGIKQINLRILNNICAHHLTTESKLDLIDSKVDELFPFITSEHEVTRETIITRIAELHVTMESKLDLIDSKVDELFPHITSEHEITRETIIDRIAELHVTMESKLDLIDSKVEEIIFDVIDEHEITRETIITRISQLHVTMESKLDLIDSKVEEIIPVVIFEHEDTRETIITRIAEFHVTMESKLDLIDNKVEEIINTVEIEHDTTRETIIERISELHVTMESKLDLIDSKISYILEQGTGGDGGTCDCPTPIDDAYLAEKGGVALIDEPGSYILCQNITRAFTIQVSDVTLDLNGFTITAEEDENGININNSLANVTIKNGYIVGHNQASLGIIVESGCKCIKVKNICITNFNTGIFFYPADTKACLIKNCIIKECNSGIFILTLRKSTFENVKVINCGTGFFLFGSSHNYFDSCKVKNATNIGFNIQLENSNNTFTNCVAKNINGDGQDAIGFLIDSNETKLIHCTISDVVANNEEALGIAAGRSTQISGTKIVNCIIKNIGSENSNSPSGINLTSGSQSVIENNNIGIIKGKTLVTGIVLVSNSNNNIIQNNTIYDVVNINDSRASGIFINPAATQNNYNVVDNNIISNVSPKSDGTDPLVGTAIYADESANCISRNISYNNEEDGPSALGASFWDINLATNAPMVNAAHMFSTAENYFNLWYP